ncbi:WD40 repeat domain-containing protein [Halomonas alkaliantarctica]|uniref:WD40 repeat domain-containing protein n=1 Tax=Halomonas alkaliantarctica TaxID=232346 RepID=A0ABY8LT39_9GAMM|nr:WD40 repeat domain-containing protein [Halomonas alkaliantarctica]WGI26767.1 WD40 repeat domain-containing protein [Halomonas alkaliantarctica]
MNKQKFAALILVVGTVLALAYYGVRALTGLEPATSLSMSSDGRYVISAHEDGALVLWDIEDQQKEQLADNANLYSAYFIPEGDVFLWQDQDDVVYVQRVNGDVVEEFEHFPTYGHVMSVDRQHYLSSNKTWNIYHGHGDALRPVLLDSHSPSFTGTGQVLNLSMGGDFFVSGGSGSPGGELTDSPPVREEGEFRFSSSYGGVTLWDIDTLEPVAKLPGNSSKTYATISPDGDWVVSGDENGIGLFWDTNSPENRMRLADYDHGVFLQDLPEGLPENQYRDKSELIPVPESTKPDKWGSIRSLATPTTIALAFINGSEEFLRIGHAQYEGEDMSRTYAALFEAGNPWPQAYLDLGTDPFPSVNNYSRNLSIDSAPDANLLVTGHAFDGGITVYRYDPEERTLAKEWVGR